jgi:sulfatase modifying factor 1
MRRPLTCQPFASVALSVAFVLIASPARAVTIDWISVGDPGNAADTTGFGAVSNVYRISKTEVTNAQYAEFLNAVAVSHDQRAVYHTSMEPTLTLFGGIRRSQSADRRSYSYAAVPGLENLPVNWVSFYDGVRFANWLHNGQPVGPQASGTTEDGAYTITAAGVAANSITRNAGATFFLPSEHEWYKAAYYDPVSASYHDYPAGTDAQTVCARPGATPNTANCNGALGLLADVASYPASASPLGTFDQGGNLSEWNEAIIGTNRGVRGGMFPLGPPSTLGAATRGDDVPSAHDFSRGFRIASIPEPSTGLLLAMGLLPLGVLRRSLISRGSA